ncbi:MAG: 4Fe-4S binding protein, partial [Dinghuibacter sp.]|nr:4Fe-4S binding protein [Dinghuibacter sp.]
MSQHEVKEQVSFRDRMPLVTDKGKRKWIYAQKPHGKFYNIRSIVSIFYLLLFFSLPLIKINGFPAVQINIPEAKFYFFGMVFWPQDFFIFGLMMVAFVVFIVLFTMIYGRVFCGWACPQTIFMEMVFRRIETWIEGSAAHQRQLNHGSWTTERIIRKTAKHIAFFLLSFLIANTFLAYIIGADELFRIISEPVSEHIGGFLAIVGFTFVFYFVYAFVR